jgi:hypothetical protein
MVEIGEGTEGESAMLESLQPGATLDKQFLKTAKTV